VAVAWTGIALFVFAQQASIGAVARGPRPPMAPLAYHLTTCWSWAIFTPLIWELGLRFSFQRPVRDAAVHLLACLAMIALEAQLLVIAFPVMAGVRLGFVDRMLRLLLVDLFTYVTLVIIALALRQRTRVRGLEAHLFEARLEALEAQLRPHFLFNALNTVSSLVRSGESQGAIRALAALGDVLRGSLRRTGTEVPLGDELGLAERYLDLERARFGDAIRYRVTAAPGTTNARVPPLLLQPLVENALAHGRGPDGKAEVEIDVARQGDELRIEVRDAGSGPPQGFSLGVGLTNTRARLSHMYGDGARFELLRRPEGGAVAVVALPLREALP
jgi:hypothetical protein